MVAPTGGRISFSIHIGLCGALLALATAALAEGPSARALGAAVARYAQGSTRPLPIPDNDQLEALANGETVSLRRYIEVANADADVDVDVDMQAEARSEQRILVTGYQWVARPRLLVWLATLDVGTAHSDALTEHLLSVDGRGGAIWYQHMDLPWPMRNRHWMIQSRKNLVLATASGGTIWEHQWQLANDGLARSRELLARSEVDGLNARSARSAIYLSLNRGAWAMIDLGDGTTLVVTHALAVMGGWIPDEWVAGFVARQLGHVLQNLAGRADSIHATYTAMPPVFSGDGVPIAPALALEAWRDYSTSGAHVTGQASDLQSNADAQP